MSPHAVNNFVSDLVLMAQAMERLPHVEADLAEARAQIEAAQNTVQRLELKLIDRAAIIDDLNAKLRTVEAERDEAIGTFLEADERTSRALDFIKATFGNAGALIQALDGPKANGEAKAEQGQSETTPMEHSSAGHGGMTIGQVGAEPFSAATSPADPAAVSVPTDPIVEPSLGSESETVPGESATAQADASGSEGEGESQVQPPPPNGPYTGKRYIDVPGYVRLDDWLAGGGTEADYYAGREGVAPSGFSTASHYS
jgi:hypothetical protein